MKIVLPIAPGSRRRQAGFTMVELALCIGIIAFAMVAIMGVLPSGLSVQKQNREDTIMDQEGAQWINILKNGHGGWGDLTNYLDNIVVERRMAVGLQSGSAVTYGFRGRFFNETIQNPITNLSSASLIVSLLSLPKLEADSGEVFSNRVTAVVRAMAGSQNAQIRPTLDPGFEPSSAQLDDAFRYQMEVELTPVASNPSLDMTAEDPSFTNLFTLESIQSGGWLNAYRLDPDNVLQVFKGRGVNRSDVDPLAATLYDLKLTFRWPVFKVGNEYRVGAGSRTFRTQLAGRLVFDRYVQGSPGSVYLPKTLLRPRRFEPSVVTRVAIP
ncbi:MAG: type II secretion system protein [Verrucomicrobia bacterium]|nr:type II secretion system protein [Verrucomicrobiota bacterium]